jgi:hypothetical protein
LDAVIQYVNSNTGGAEGGEGLPGWEKPPKKSCCQPLHLPERKDFTTRSLIEIAFSLVVTEVTFIVFPCPDDPPARDPPRQLLTLHQAQGAYEHL